MRSSLVSDVQMTCLPGRKHWLLLVLSVWICSGFSRWSFCDSQRLLRIHKTNHFHPEAFLHYLLFYFSLKALIYLIKSICLFLLLPSPIYHHLSPLTFTVGPCYDCSLILSSEVSEYQEKTSNNHI